ncbi:MAG TPA: anaerobic glycerol-3-phosphate dehydrogenase subunit B [Syntrophobacteraceae bacterium]|nr:anaerobic glycerol-3-phosphate dehydrogenase subunit B [Syntrophobacteraceae bacterium]
MPDEVPVTHRASSKIDLIIIGSGLAGTAAACFAVTQGLKVAQISASLGELPFASGLLDLLAIYPRQEQKLWDNPWDGIAALIDRSPSHPYAKLGVDTIREAMQGFLAFLEASGLEHHGLPDGNVHLATAVGTLKTTYRVPQSMWHGVGALQQKLPTLLVDFYGMKDFHGRLMLEGLRHRWPTLNTKTLPFPMTFPGVDRQNLLFAEALESPEVRAELADSIRPNLDGAQMVGMPAVLGVHSTAEVIADLEGRLGVGIFEIPTLPPSVPGLRLQETCENSLRSQGVQILQDRRVIGFQTDGLQCTGIITGTDSWRETTEADGIILASGRFLGGGLAAERNGIIETIFGLPVVQPSARNLWHRDRFLDHRGHPVNQAGLAVDNDFRPLGPDGKVAFQNLFAAGSILAHQDWIRTKSGAGLAIATAYGAVEAFLRAAPRD